MIIPWIVPPCTCGINYEADISVESPAWTLSIACLLLHLIYINYFFYFFYLVIISLQLLGGAQSVMLIMMCGIYLLEALHMNILHYKFVISVFFSFWVLQHYYICFLCLIGVARYSAKDVSSTQGNWTPLPSMIQVEKSLRWDMFFFSWHVHFAVMLQQMKHHSMYDATICDVCVMSQKCW